MIEQITQQAPFSFFRMGSFHLRTLNFLSIFKADRRINYIRRWLKCEIFIWDVNEKI